MLQGYLTALEVAHSRKKLDDTDFELRITRTAEFLEHYPEIMEQTEKWYLANQKELLNMRKGCVAAYGLNYCTAIEAELKLFETFKHPVRGYEMEEMIHGPQMAFDEDTYVFLVASEEKELERVPRFIQFFEENHITEHVFVITANEMKLKEKDLKELITKKRTRVFRSWGKSKKTGKPYDAYLELQPKGSTYATQMKFPEREN